MPQINIPQRKDNLAGLGAIGAVAGFVAPPVGAAIGAAQIAGNLSKPKPVTPIPQDNKSSAMMRRMDDLKQDNLMQLQEAQASLKTLPPDLQKQYAEPLATATMLEKQQRGLV